MLPGPANVLSCPYCGGEKEVMSLMSGNTMGGTVWSDTRRYYPMLPEVSPIQKCPHCGKYYFIDQAKSRYSDDRESEFRSFGELGTLTLRELMEAKRQMEKLTLTKLQRWVLNHQIFLAYNDLYRRKVGKVEITDGNGENVKPTGKEKAFYDETIEDLLEGIESGKGYALFHAELLRETGRFEEATNILLGHDSEEDRWLVRNMLRHIEEGDTEPFLLIDDGEMVM